MSTNGTEVEQLTINLQPIRIFIDYQKEKVDAEIQRAKDRVVECNRKKQDYAENTDSNEKSSRKIAELDQSLLKLRQEAIQTIDAHIKRIERDIEKLDPQKDSVKLRELEQKKAKFIAGKSKVLEQNDKLRQQVMGLQATLSQCVSVTTKSKILAEETIMLDTQTLAQLDKQKQMLTSQQATLGESSSSQPLPLMRRGLSP